MEKDPEVPVHSNGKFQPRKFTSKELSHCNKPHNVHVAYRGKVYNVSQFVSEHPGGKDQIMLGAGRDITPMFDSYHPLDTHKVLEKYYVGELIDHDTPTFPEMGEFYKTLRKRVDNFFRTNNIDPKMDCWVVLRYICFVLATIFFNFATIYFHSSLVYGMICSLVAGFFSANIALSLTHDTSHFAFTHKPWVWKVLGASHDFFLGASHYVWSHQHVVGHHIYTNIDGFDPDLQTADNNQADWRRLKRAQKWFPHYIYQHIYFPIMYGFLAVKFRVRDIISLLTLNYSGMIRINQPSTSQLFIFIIGKLCWVFHHIIIPLYFMPWATMVLLTVIQDLFASYYLTVVILTSHVVEKVECYQPDENKKMYKDWAELQVASTMDYATDSWFCTVFSGAINHQTIHHLLPGVLQSHYPKVAHIVRQTCADFGLEYIYTPTVFEAVACHISFLQNLGQRTYGKEVSCGRKKQ